MSFSGAVKIADSFDDYLSPSQNCIKPFVPKANDATVTDKKVI
jgi:hypothetical protein